MCRNQPLCEGLSDGGGGQLDGKRRKSKYRYHYLPPMWGLYGRVSQIGDFMLKKEENYSIMQEMEEMCHA